MTRLRDNITTPLKSLSDPCRLYLVEGSPEVGSPGTVDGKVDRAVDGVAQPAVDVKDLEERVHLVKVAVILKQIHMMFVGAEREGGYRYPLSP